MWYSIIHRIIHPQIHTFSSVTFRLHGNGRWITSYLNRGSFLTAIQFRFWSFQVELSKLWIARPLAFRFSEIMHMQIIILIYKAICMQCENPWKFLNCNKTADFEWYAFLIDPFWSILSVKHTTFPNWKILLLHFRDVFFRFVSAWFESGSKYWFDKQPWNN